MANTRNPNGSGSWGTKKIKGKTYLRYTKTYPFERKDFYGSTKSEIKAKVDIFESKNHLESNKDIQLMIFSTYASNWLFKWRSKNLKPKTFDYYEYIINNYIKGSKLGKTQIKAINNQSNKALEKIATELLHKYTSTLSRSTINGIHTVLTQICNYGFSHLDLTFNFMANVEKIREDEVKKPTKKLIALNFQQLSNLHNELFRKNEVGNIINGKAGSYVYGINSYAILFAGYTGLRFGEISSLKWDDINFEKKIIYINKQNITVKNRDEKIDKKYITIESSPKSHDSKRYVPLNDYALKILELVIERFNIDINKNRNIFTLNGKPLNNSNSNRLLKKMCQRAEIPEITFHELRHSFASILLNQDTKTLNHVAYLLGHSSPDVTYKKYIDIFEEQLAETSKIFDNIGSPK